MGWYVVAIIVVSLCLSTRIQEKYNNWKRKKDDLEYAAKYHKGKTGFMNSLIIILPICTLPTQDLYVISLHATFCRIDPDVYQERLAKMEAARLRMQEKYAADAEKARQKEQEVI